jgi:hypothetical protein
MMPKSGSRFSEKIMLKQEAGPCSGEAKPGFQKGRAPINDLERAPI